ncbi:MAG TPA: AAA family ATPase [Planctomycetota bacterium]|nr:AAA family ATPase [Planctomycetota bacterium]
MPRVIAIMNQKGGVGKTTTTLNLGAALAGRGKRVLLVDLDPQANLTIGLGKRAADLSESVYELLTNPKVETAKLIVPTNWERLHIVPSHIDLSGAEIEMVTMIGRETRLTKSLDAVRENYDYIFIDCLPSLSLLTVNAMAAATEVFVPLQAHPFAMEGLGKLFEVVGMIREAMNPALRVSGVLVTMFDGRTNVSKVTLEALRRDERLREHIFTTTIKQNIKVAESQKEGIPVITFDPACHAAKAYQALCSEVLEMENGCLASLCAERITSREKAAGERLTFTPDLIAPPTRPQETHSAEAQTPAAPAEPLVHVAPVTALVGNHEAPPPPEEQVPPEKTQEAVSAPPPAPEISAPAEAPQVVLPQAAAEPVPVVAVAAESHSPAAAEVAQPPVTAAVVIAAPANSADVQSLHPSKGIAVSIPANADVTAALQAAQSMSNPPPAREAHTPSLHADLSDEGYRPRLQLKPGSLSITLPPIDGNIAR